MSNVVSMHNPEVPVQPPTQPTTEPRRLSEGEALQFEHTSYVLISRTHACTSCNAVQNFSDLHEVWTHPTKTALTNAKILKAAHRVEPGFPVASVVTPVVAVPICHECVGNVDAAANRTFPAVSYSAWSDTLHRKAKELAEDRRAATARTTAKPAPSLDQL